MQEENKKRDMEKGCRMFHMKQDRVDFVALFLPLFIHFAARHMGDK